MNISTTTNGVYDDSMSDVMEMNDDDNSGRPLTDNQERILYTLNTVAGIASMIGSFLILKIVRNSKRRKGSLSVYDRLLVGLSISDLMASSLFWVLGSYMMPKGDRVWALGNDTTCNITGWLASALTISLLYSSMISFYYALLVRYSFRDEQLRGKIEYSMHLVSILWPLLSYSVGLILDAFGPRLIGLNCYLSDYPKGCVDVAKNAELEEGEVRCKNDLTNILISGIPAAFGTVLILGCNLMIYCHVRSSVRLYQKRALARQKDSRDGSIGKRTSTRTHSRATEETSSNSIHIRKAKQSLGKRSFFRNSLKDLSSSFRELTREILNQDQQTQQVRAVMNQSLFYVGAMMMVNIPLILQVGIGGNPSTTRENESNIFVFLCFTTFLSPLQGIFNLMIFCRPTYLRMRRSFPTDSCLQSFLKTIEVGTSDSRGGGGGGGKRWQRSVQQQTQIQQQLSSHPQSRKSVCNSCNGWLKNLMGRQSFTKSDFQNSNSNVNSTVPKPLCGQSAEFTFKMKNNNESVGNQDEDKSNFDNSQNDDDNYEDDDEVIQLEMVEESSASSSSSPQSSLSSKLSSIQDNTSNTIGVNENELTVSPEWNHHVNTNTTNINSNSGGPYQDWHHIEFDSSCVAFFSSTTSTIEA